MSSSEKERSNPVREDRRVVAVTRARCNLFTFSCRMNNEDITMAVQKARRKAMLAHGGASCAEVVHHPRACAGDVKQDASCLSQFPRFFRAISAGPNFRPVSARFRERREEGTNERTTGWPPIRSISDSLLQRNEQKTVLQVDAVAGETRFRASSVRTMQVVGDFIAKSPDYSRDSRRGARARARLIRKSD